MTTSPPPVAAAPETAAERDRLKEVNAELVEALKALVSSQHKHHHGCGAGA